MVTGSGFDFIQTAVMKVDGNNMTAVEVHIPSVPFLLLLFIVVGFFSFHQVLFLSPHVFEAYFSLWAPLTIATVAINISTRCESISLASVKKNSKVLPLMDTILCLLYISLE